MQRKHALHPRTALINKAQQILSKNGRDNALKWLAQRFPEAFNNKERIRPLKIGIIHDLLKHSEEAKNAGISHSKLRTAVVLFTRRLDYLLCLKAQEMRIDLNGHPIEPVTAEEAEQARTKLKTRMERSLRYKKEETAAITTAGSTKKMSLAPKDLRPLEPNPASAVLIKHKVTRRYDPVMKSINKRSTYEH